MTELSNILCLALAQPVELACKACVTVFALELLH